MLLRGAGGCGRRRDSESRRHADGCEQRIESSLSPTATRGIEASKFSCSDSMGEGYSRSKEGTFTESAEEPAQGPEPFATDRSSYETHFRTGKFLPEVRNPAAAAEHGHDYRCARTPVPYA